MGHSSIQVTVDIYGHLIPGSNKAAVDRLDGPVDKVAFERKTAAPMQSGGIGATSNRTEPLG